MVTKPGRAYETVARLDIDADSKTATIRAQSPAKDTDLVLEGKGGGIVRVGDSEVLTLDSLTDLDALAAVLAGITVEGADPALVTALQGQVAAIFDTFAGKAGATVADLIAYAVGVDDNLATVTTMAFSAQSGLQQFLTTVADNPDPSLITVANGGLAGLAGKAWEALLAQVAAGGDVQLLLDGVTGITDATVQQFVDTVRSYGSGTNNVMLGLAALFDAIVGKPGATFEEVEEVFANGFGGGGDIQPLLDVLSANPGSGTGSVADVEAVMQALSDASTMIYLLVNALSGKPNGVGSVAEVLPFLQAAITSVVEFNLSKPLGGPLQVATTVTAGVSGDTAEIIAFSPDARPANLDLQAPGGTVTVNGAAITLLSQYQALINALCSAPLTGMSGTTVTSVGTWAAIIKQELESLGANLQIAYDKTVENKNAIAALFTENTALTTENTALKKRLDDLEYAVRELSTGNAAGLVSQAAFDGFTQSIGGEINTLSNTVNNTAATVATKADRTEVQAVDTALTDYTRANDVKVQAVTNDMQGMLDGYAEQPGGSLRNFEDFYNGFKAFVAKSMTDNKNLLDTVEGILNESVPALEATSAQIVEWVVDNYATKPEVATVATTLQALMDAMNGPNATPAIIQQMFWILDDVLMQTINILNITVPGQGE